AHGAGFLAIAHRCGRWPSTPPSQAKESGDCWGGDDCCAAIGEIASRERSPTAARLVRWFMRAPGDSVPDGVLRRDYLFRKMALAGAASCPRTLSGSTIKS